MNSNDETLGRMFADLVMTGGDEELARKTTLASGVFVAATVAGALPGLPESLAAICAVASSISGAMALWCSLKILARAGVLSHRAERSISSSRETTSSVQPD